MQVQEYSWELLVEFILVISQLDAQNLFYNKFFHACTCFEHHVLIVRRSKIVLYSLWYHNTCRWQSGARDAHL